MRKDRTQTGLQSTLIRRKKQWSGVAIWQRGKDQNLFLMAQMVRFIIPTAMEMTHVHPRTPGIKHCSSWRQQASDTACYFYSILSFSFFLRSMLFKRDFFINTSLQKKPSIIPGFKHSLASASSSSVKSSTVSTQGFSFLFILSLMVILFFNPYRITLFDQLLRIFQVRFQLF